MTERTERDAHSAVIQQLEPSWKTAPKRTVAPDRRAKRRDGEVWLLLVLLVLLICSAWWVWLA